MTPNGIFAVGDSRTVQDIWLVNLVDNLSVAAGIRWAQRPRNFGVNAISVAGMRARVDADLPGVSEAAPTVILCNLGVVDTLAMPAEEDWEADYLAIIDAFQAKWPGVPIYLAKPWWQGKTALCNTLAGWIDVLLASRSNVFVGHDERVWLEGGDDGATMTGDGVHYTAAGHTECAAQWQAILGY